jgi:hypothetical protein
VASNHHPISKKNAQMGVAFEMVGGMGFIRIKKMLTLRAVSLCSTLPTLRFGRTGGFIHTPLAPTKKAPINGTFFIGRRDGI